MNVTEKVNASDQQHDHLINLSSESVAGEEDPGAALDMPNDSPGPSVDTAPTFGNKSALNPGDEAPAGMPGTGEAGCRDCGGSGQLSGTPCRACGGTGKVTVGLAGA